MAYFCEDEYNNRMKIVNVIPIAKEIFRENLSYFSAKNAPVGALVIVPMRGKNTPAIVVSVEDVKGAKSRIKSSNFQMKAVKSVKSLSFVRPEFIDASREIADYFVSSTGAVIKDFLPQAILESGLDESSLRKSGKQENVNYGCHEIMLFQSPKKERLQYYKSIIREEFAKDHSVFFCLPTISDVVNFSEELQRGIEKYAITYHGKLTKKKAKETWLKAKKEKHPLLIVATKSFLSISRKDINVIIIDHENSSAYKIQKRPYLDVRKSAEIISKKLKTKLIFGDNLIRSETLYRQENGEFSSLPVSYSRILSAAEQIIVDIKESTLSDWQKKMKGNVVISQELQKLLEKIYKNNERAVLFVNRRGYSHTTVCADCQHVMLCEKCDAPFVLHKNESSNKKIFFTCHKCLSEKPVPEKCPRCKSWRLETFGIGVQKTAEEVARFFPKIKIFKMDSDSIAKDSQGREMINAFLSASGAVLIGTELVFSYLNQPVERVAIVSIDGLFTIPDFRINEKIFQLLLKLRLLTKKTFLVQTRLPEQNVFQNIIKGNISGFYKEEIESRKRFNYPPFKLLIKITKDGKNDADVAKEIEKLKKILNEWGPLSYKAFIPKIKNIYRRHVLLKIDPQSWPNEQRKLHAILSSLVPSWKVEVDPESLL